jgi:CDP-glucose 4,6-dehydratase
MKLDSDFWHGRRVLLTGHTGFKGSWMALILKRLGADVFGVSLDPEQSPNMYELLSPWDGITSIHCDIRNLRQLNTVVHDIQPEIVIHMAAQALVVDAYENPVETIATNTMGTVHLLESLRAVKGIECILVITSDKVYENEEHCLDFSESSRLGGHEAYSASKAAAEILTSAYQRTYFSDSYVPVLTARAGNVIGGGDWSRNRLVPDLWRAYTSRVPAKMRNPSSIRPWQHVLDPLYGYMLYIQYAVLNKNIDVPKSLNFGPPRYPYRSVLEMAQQFSNTIRANNLWEISPTPFLVRESSFLAIDSSLAFETLEWKTALNVNETIRMTSDWYYEYSQGNDMRAYTELQLNEYASLVQDDAIANHSSF